MSETRSKFNGLSFNTLVDNLMIMFEGNEAPTLSEVDIQVDHFLQSPLAQNLTSRREEIISTFLERINVRIDTASFLDDETGHEPWIHEADRSDWRLWNRLSDYLKHEGMPATVVAELDNSTDSTLGRLESPIREARYDRRGMVVGHVQSGKTTHYTALSAKAFDAGYRIVVILAGLHNNLRSQTHSRIDRYLLGRDSLLLHQGEGQGRPIGVEAFQNIRGFEGPNYQVITCTTADENGDFNQAQASRFYFQVNAQTRLIMVVKKNGSVLRRLRNWLNGVMQDSSDTANSLIPHPTLFIDDEADQASMNTNIDDENPSTINGLIRQLLVSFRRVGFVGYTATPFANVFADPDATSGGHGDQFGEDLFPKSFIVNLKAPSNYIGPSTVFGHEGDESIGIDATDPLPMHIDVDDTESWLPAKHKKHHVPGPLPKTLTEAMQLFVLVCAARCCRGDTTVHNSMLVHATRFVDTQKRIFDQVCEELEILRTRILHGADDTRCMLLSMLRGLWEREIAAKHVAFTNVLPSSVLSLPEWLDVLSWIPVVLRKLKVMRINGSSDDALAYSNNESEGLWVIVIGGDKLSRGLTLEGLSISYFLRTSKAFDTLMQMGRWFGYRTRYVDLCRVYTQGELVSAFRQIASATEDLRADLDRLALSNREPKDFGMRVRSPSDGLMITARNKIRRGEPIQVRYAGTLVQALQMPARGQGALNNRKALEDLIQKLGMPTTDVRGKQVPWKLWKDVQADLVICFLERYEATRTHSFLNHSDRLREYIHDRIHAAGELKQWTVCLMGKMVGESTKIAGHDVKLLMRKRDPTSPEGEFFTRAVVGSAEEAADLSVNELALTVEKTSPHLRMRSNVHEEIGSRESIREVRQRSGRGLLLLYPIHQTTADGRSLPPEDYVVSAAISFPTSATAVPLTYTVNEVWKRDFGFLEEPDGDA